MLVEDSLTVYILKKTVVIGWKLILSLFINPIFIKAKNPCSMVTIFYVRQEHKTLYGGSMNSRKACYRS